MCGDCGVERQTVKYWISIRVEEDNSPVAWWSELLTTNHEVPGSIPGSNMCVFP